jgi:Ser/Thr protein kinase RdoA (MazF antagonist)
MHQQFEDHHQEPVEDLLDLQQIRQAFGVEQWTILGPAEEQTQAGRLSLSVEIEGQRYVLKERAEGPTEEDFSHYYDFRRYLQAAGVPIPALLLTPQGAPAVEIGESCFELEQWFEGERFSTTQPRSRDYVAASGAMLGQIHLASRSYSGPQHRWPSEAHMGGMVQGYLNLARLKAEECPIQALAAGLSQWADQWEAVLPQAMVSIGAGRDLAEFHIHGDYQALNLRFGPAGVTSVEGLEASHWEKRIFEVAYALFSFSALAWQPGEALTRPLVKRGLDPERARYFLQAYSEIYPPSSDEAALLADALLLISPIAIINGPLEDLFYTQEEPDAALIDDVMERLSWATALPGWVRRVRDSLSAMWQ